MLKFRLGAQELLKIKLGTHDVLKLRLMIQNFLMPRLGEPACVDGHFEAKAGGQKYRSEAKAGGKSTDMWPTLWMPRLQ